MFYFKLIAKNGDILGAEQFETLQYVRQLENGYVIRSSEHNAQGIISFDQSATYQLDGRPAMTGDYALAVEINGDEYAEIHGEDPDPSVDPDDQTPAGEDVLTRKELTAKVAKLEEMNAMLTGMLLENREDGMKASKAYSEGDLVVVNGELYKVISRIASGAALTVGTNMQKTTLAAEIAAVNS